MVRLLLLDLFVYLFYGVEPEGYGLADLMKENTEKQDQE
jgi:hypothetical protein